MNSEVSEALNDENNSFMQINLKGECMLKSAKILYKSRLGLEMLGI